MTTTAENKTTKWRDRHNSQAYFSRPKCIPMYKQLRYRPFENLTVLPFLSFLTLNKANFVYLRKIVFNSSCCRTFTIIARPCSKAICEFTSSSVGSFGSPIRRGSFIISANLLLKSAITSGCES